MKKYSSNAGQPIKEVQVIGLAGAIRLFNKLRASGQTFRIDWVKKNGEHRTASSARFGVHAGLTGDGQGYDSLEKGLMTIYEFGKGWRQVQIDTIENIKHGGVLYLFNSPLPKGVYSPRILMRVNKNGNKTRTLPVHDSPLYV